MYWTRLGLVRPVVSLYSASPLKHHAMGRQWYPNPDHYPDCKPASQSLTLMCWALRRAAEPQILMSFVWCGRGSNHQPPACQAQPLHYPAVVRDILRKVHLKTSKWSRILWCQFTRYMLYCCPRVPNFNYFALQLSVFEIQANWRQLHWITPKWGAIRYNCTTKKILYNHQYGFRNHHSTSQAVTELVSTVLENFDAKNIWFVPSWICQKLLTLLIIAY